MAIIAVIILILYYYFFVIFEKNIDKPQNISKPVVDLKNEISNGNKLKPDEYYDYDSGLVKGPFEYSIHHDDIKKEISFTAPDNDYSNKIWSVPLISNYYWSDKKIVETDSCFNIPNNSNVKAEGKALYNYIQNNNLITDQQIGSLSKKIFHSDRLFYFKCNNNKIESLHSCPAGTILNDQIQCEKIHSCIGQPNNFTFPDENSKFKYFKCVNGKPRHEQCKPGEIFQYDKCVVPQNLCEVSSDGFLSNVDRKSFLNCVNGEAILFHCPPYTYALNGKCENEVCENKLDNMVPIISDNGTFAFAGKYGQCKDGKLIKTFECPTRWDYFDTDANILHLPQVFDLNTNSCTKPVLCENVKITDPNVIVPQYSYAKYLKNWGFSKVFDLLTGYKCDNSGNRIQVNMDPGELIINFKRTKISSNLSDKIPTSDATKYFNVLDNKIEDCPAGSFFDGSACKPKIPNSFSFKHLDIFKFDNLHINGWINPNRIDYTRKTVSCTGDYVPMNSVQACVHKDCTRFEFLFQVKGSIKLDNRFECAKSNDKIIKHKYENPHNLNLEFWDQRLVENPKNICTPGTNIKTGNFVLDSTVFMTCNHNQPFVFCPSALTETIQPISNTYACVPKQSVYELIIPQKRKVLLYLNEILSIEILKPTFVTINTLTQYLTNTTTLNTFDIKQWIGNNAVSFYFECDDLAKVKFNKLPTNPENIYLENGVLKMNQSGIYDIIYDHRQAKYLQPKQYNLEDSVIDFKY